MTVRNRVIATVASASLLGCGILVAQERHPHIHKARELGRQAYDQLSQAEAFGNVNADNHIQKAKDDLVRANNELDAALAAER